MKLKEHKLKIQTENPVDFKSLTFHGCDVKEYYVVQGLLNYFNLLNGPTYKALIRHFWVRASVYDREASELEEQEKILIDPTLAGKSREEMGLEPFTCTKIRSSLMGVDDSQLFDIFSVIFITFWSSQGNLSSKKSKKVEGNTKEKNVPRLV